MYKLSFFTLVNVSGAKKKTLFNIMRTPLQCAQLQNFMTITMIWSLGDKILIC